MGIDRRDVRAVIHHTMSKNLEEYVQEAGRDKQPAICTLLFDRKDADTAFFLQSLNQLSEPELRNVFLAFRKLRNQIFGEASEDYFWVTTNEIFQVSDLDHKFASDQVKIDSSRVGQGGLDVYSIRLQDDNYQAGYINQQVKKWIEKDGIKPGDIAILTRNWDYLDKARALLEHRSGIPTYSLKGEDVKLVRSYTTQLLITDLEKNLNLILAKEEEESVKARFEHLFARHNIGRKRY